MHGAITAYSPIEQAPDIREFTEDGGLSSLHLVSSAFAVENMSRFSGAFPFTPLWIFAAADEGANLVAANSLLFRRNNFFLSVSHCQSPH
jgi:hypothetical protein